MNVSIVSVSRRAGPPHFGHFAFTNSGTLASGDCPCPVSSTFSGSRTGKIVRHRHDAALRAIDHRDRRAPVALARNAPILQPVGDLGFADAFGLARRRSSSRWPASLESPLYGPESTRRPYSVKASFISLSDAAQRPSSGWITTRNGISYLRANSKSRWSCAGTAMTAPVPYSASTKFATQIGTLLAGKRIHRKAPGEEAFLLRRGQIRAANDALRAGGFHASSSFAAPGLPGKQARQQRMRGRKNHGRSAVRSCPRAW